MTKIVKKIEKIASFIKKIDKICDNKKLKTIQLPLKTMQPHIIKPLKGFLNTEAEKSWIMTKKLKLLKVNFFKKMLKFVMLKYWKKIPLRPETIQ